MAIVLHIGNAKVKKIWKFNSQATYSCDEVESTVVDLFPEICAKKLRLDLSYEDDLVGEIPIESDGDLELAFQSFVEKEMCHDRDLKYRTLHVRECIIPTLKQGGKSYCSILLVLSHHFITDKVIKEGMTSDIEPVKKKRRRNSQPAEVCTCTCMHNVF